ncbi:MAG: hypothetical protein Q8O89_01905, partial [Nanoarchaeota archaeon]|nr:hypothetical protein [Nanoarchaeota archaeon]
MMDFNEAVQNIKQTAALMPAEYRTAAALGTGYLIGAYGKKLACGVADVISDVNEALYNRAQFGSGILNKTWYAMN